MGYINKPLCKTEKNIEKNSHSKPETILFQIFNPDTTNYDIWSKGVREFQQ